MITAAVIAAMAGLAYASKDEVDQVTSGILKKTPQFVENQRTGVYLPGSFRFKSNLLDMNVMVPRIPGGGERLQPTAIADVYAQATANGIERYRKAAFEDSDRIVTVPKTTRPGPLVTGVSSRVMGNLTDYQHAYYDNDTLQDGIETRQDIFKDPYPSDFPGPSYDRYPLATAPDRLRSIWGVEGLASRDAKQSRQSGSNTRPVLARVVKTRQMIAQNNKPFMRMFAE